MVGDFDTSDGLSDRESSLGGAASVSDPVLGVEPVEAGGVFDVSQAADAFDAGGGVLG